jgi:hypothetical protein
VTGDHSGHTEAGGVPVRVEQTERSFTQATESAMGNDILMGLIELITNADDQYGDQPGSILVRFPKPDAETTWDVEVRDKASGLGYDEIGPKLLRFGGRTSGHERGEIKRGNRGRGAKDLSHFGRVRWDMFKDGRYCWVWLDRHGNGQKSLRAVRADEYRDEFGIPKNGVVATVTCDRVRVRRPQRDRIKHRLEYAVQLRRVMANPKRSVKLQYGDDDAVNLRYVPPSGLVEFPAVEVEVPGYERKARVVVAEVPTPFQEDQNDQSRPGGLLIESGRAVHEATLYGFENSPYAGYFLGSVRWETIDDLARDFDDRDEAGLPVDPANPMQIIRADRRGLNAQHPAVKQLRSVIDAVLRPHFDRKAQELSGGARESRLTKQRLDALARVVAKYQAAKAEELEFELARTGAQGVELTADIPIVEVIPPRKVLEVGRVHTFTVRVRSDAFVDDPSQADVLLWLAADPDGCVELSGPKCTLTRDARLEGRLTGTFTARAAAADGSAIIEVTVPRLPGAVVEIETVEPETPFELPPPDSFSFDRPTYRVAAGKHKQVLLVAPAHLVGEHGVMVTALSSDSQGVLVRHARADLALSPDGDWYEARIDVEGRQHGASATLTAALGQSGIQATTKVDVRRDRGGPTPPEIKLAAMGSFVRGTFEASPDTGAIVITVNATHPSVSRYFGKSPEFVGQETLQARLMIAEIVADLTVLDILRRHLRQQPLPVEQLYVHRFRMLKDLLPLCHASQVVEEELPAIKPARQRSAKSGATGMTN